MSREELTGLSGFVSVNAEIRMYFPLGTDGNTSINCKQCRFFRTSSARCAITEEIPYKPEKYVGNDCPFLESLIDLTKN